MQNATKSQFEMAPPLGASRGFTLVELMIVVAIIGVLSAIAIPAYSDYVIKAKIPEATAMLASKRIQLEQYFQDNRKYEAAATACSSNLATSNFTYACSVPSSSTYTITATGTGTMEGFIYTIDQSNTRTSTIASPAKSAWQTAQQSCWVMSRGVTCGVAASSGT